MTWLLITGNWSDTGVWSDAAQWFDSAPDSGGFQVLAHAFSLDGHDFYVLKLGASETLVYDLTTGQWASWDSNNRFNWRPNSSFNWIGMLGSGSPSLPSTNIVMGDDTFGTLWVLDPSSGVDEGPLPGDALEPFTRAVTGGLPLRNRKSPRCNAVTLTMSTGDPDVTDARVQLRISDNNGRTYEDCGTVSVPPNNYFTEVRWRSLGLMRAPGRVFEFIDTGATVRIDGADAQLNGETT